MTNEDLRQQSEQLLAKVKEARAKVAASEGAKLQSELSAVSRTYKIFTANEQELRAHFHRYTDLTALLELWDISHRERFEAFLDETDRLLHNYLAAAGSLAEHTMRLWSEYPPQDEEVVAEYERRVAETFGDSPLAHFIRGLRNLTLHRKLPVLQGTMSFTQTELISVTGLNKKELEDGRALNHARSLPARVAGTKSGARSSSPASASPPSSSRSAAATSHASSQPRPTPFLVVIRCRS